jgi:predicted Zn finger-like uncharacterized protein
VSLTTTCPNCRTVFKVVPDQLKLRRGLVRCGTCQRVFNGLEGLRPLLEALSPMPVAPPPIPSAPTPPASIQQPVLFEELLGQEQDLNTAFFLPEYESSGEVTNTNFADVHTVPMFDERGAVNDAAIARESPLHAPLKKPLEIRRPVPIPAPTPALSPARRPAALVKEEVDAVDFFASRESEQTTLVRSFRRWAPWFVAMLSLALGLQIALAARHWIVGLLPAARPHLEPTLRKLGYDLHAPRHLDVLSLSSAEVRALEQADRFVLSAVLVNRSKHNVRWPAFLLVLNNTQGEAVVRRVLYPQEFLEAPQIANGMSGGVEQDIRVAFSIPGIRLGDYTLSLLYP